MENPKAVYDYRDEKGDVLFQVLRFEPKKFKQRRPDGQGGWIWNLNGVRRVPYLLPELLSVPLAEEVFLCEGEKDCITLNDRHFAATTVSGGSNGWKPEYKEFFRNRKIIIPADNDNAGELFAKTVAQSLYGVALYVKILRLPGLPAKGDISDFFAGCKDRERVIEFIDLVNDAPFFKPAPLTPQELALKKANNFMNDFKNNPPKLLKPEDLLMKPQEEPMEDVSQFQPMTLKELGEILGLTIKSDNINKLLVFLCQLSAYTESSQFNISFNSPSSTGKSFIPQEISFLFPETDVDKIGYCSPTSFFHDKGTFDEATGTTVIDLSHRILIFLDQPHNMLLQHLRPMLSHDQKEIQVKITDRAKAAGLRTKKPILRGYPAVIFCTAGLHVDEQESTRFFLLSPETTQEKLRESVFGRILRDSNLSEYRQEIESNAARQLLKKRIIAIKQAAVVDIIIPEIGEIVRRILQDGKILKPRDSRDTGRIISIIKSVALLNFMFRNRKCGTIEANSDDINAGFEIWEAICESQQLGLPPYVYKMYQEVILSAFSETQSDSNYIHGLSRTEILQRHNRVYGRLMPDWQLRQDILPMLESAGLIVLQADPYDKRKTLIYPAVSLETRQLGPVKTETGNNAVKPLFN